jgi:hypothetical protein
VFVAVERLLIKVRQPASRADELVELRGRLRDAVADIADDEGVLAREVRDRKLGVVEELRGLASCGTCATGAPWPRGGYDGGDCCAGVTAELFDDNELAALAHAGTRPRHLTPPPGDDRHAGCAFRGPHGCTVAAAHRPGRCVHYLCDTVRRELHARGQLDVVETKLAALSRAFGRFVAVHQARLDRDTSLAILDAIRRA